MLQIHRGSPRSLGIVGRVRECQLALPCGFRHSDSPGSRTRPAGHGPQAVPRFPASSLQTLPGLVTPLKRHSLSTHSEHRFPASFLQTLPELVMPLKGHSLYTHYRARFPASFLQTLPYSVMPLKGHALFVDTLQRIAFRHPSFKL